MTKFAAYGTELWMDGVAVANVRSINGFSLSLDTVDVTTHDSTNAWEEIIPTILRTGEMALELIYDPNNTQHAQFLSELVGRTYEDFQLRFPDTAYTMFTFNAYVASFEPSAPVDGELTASVSLKVTGTPVLNDNYTP